MSRDEYAWVSCHAEEAHGYLLPAFSRALASRPGPVIDLGCGNGALTAALATRTSTEFVGVDGSESGISHARSAYPNAEFEVADLLSPLPERLRGRFRTAIASEVVEHLLFPRQLFERAFETGATIFIVSTPYHGYAKNVALALAGRLDRHWHPLTDFGHIKFFSIRTLRQLGAECGWRAVETKRLGRIAPFAKSMLMVFTRDPDAA